MEIDLGEYEINDKDLKTKAGWTPFAGRHVVGKVKQVTLRGELAYQDGQVVAKAGSGKIVV